MSSSCAWYKLFEIRWLIFHIGNPRVDSRTKIRKTKVTEGVSGHAADFLLFSNLSLDYSHGEHEGGVGVLNYHNWDQLQKVRGASGNPSVTLPRPFSVCGK